MITLQMMKGTGPYNQMQRYIADVHKDLTPQQRAGKFTALLKKYVYEHNSQHPKEVEVSLSVAGSFFWYTTIDGDEFWRKIGKYSVKPMGQQPKVKPQPVVAEQPPVKEQPKPAAPALVWPKGATHYRPDIKRFFNEKGQWPVDLNLQFYDFVGERTYENWSALPQTIKRPETPLPNGLQWEEGYTHANRHEGQWFQFNDEHYKWRGEVKPWGLAGRKKEWFEKRTTIQRYPDNQPLILDVPPQAPVRPVGKRGDEPVPRVPEMENIAVKAPVEPPKAPPVAKKQVGWWK